MGGSSRRQGIQDFVDFFRTNVGKEGEVQNTPAETAGFRGAEPGFEVRCRGRLGGHRSGVDVAEADLFFAQGFLVAGPFVRIEQDHVEVAVFAVGRRGRHHRQTVLQAFTVQRRGLAAALEAGRQVLQAKIEEGGIKAADAAVPAHEAVFVVVGAAVIAEAPYRGGQFGGGAVHRSGIPTGAKNFGGIKRNGGDFGTLVDGLALPFHIEGLRTVFDEVDAAFAAKAAEVAQTGRTPAVEVDEDGRFGAMAFTRFDEEALVHLQVLRIDIDGDDPGADVDYGFEGGPKGGIGYNHQVAGADPEGPQSQLQRVGTVGTGHHFGDAAAFGQRFFKADGFRASDELGFGRKLGTNRCPAGKKIGFETLEIDKRNRHFLICGEVRTVGAMKLRSAQYIRPRRARHNEVIYDRFPGVYVDRPRKAATKSQIMNFKLLDLLPTMTPDEQLEVFERVIKSANPAVRPRALGLGAAILSNSRLLEYLREEDDVRRNAAVEILKLRRQRSLNLACYLLEDKDPDVVLQAVLILSHLRDRQALEPLIKALRHEDPNVVQETIIALGRIGDVRALPHIRPFLAAEQWLQVAAIETIGRIGSPEIVPELEPLFEQPVLCPLVMEALGRIGGAPSIIALARFWLKRSEEFRSEVNLRRLAEMLEALTSAPPDVPGLEEALEEQVRAGDKDVRIQAVRCLVALRGSTRGLWMF